MLDNNCTYLVAANGYLLGSESGVLRFTKDELSGLAIDAHYPVGLIDEGEYRVAITQGDSLPNGVDREELCGLRTMLSKIKTEQEYTLLASAAQIATWHDSFQFCPRCATKLDSHEDELAKVCSSCAHHQYPRISPCIIVLVKNGNRCLLAHGSKFAPGRYSTLAGFIEAGESAENAVVREVKEEVGINIENIEYCFSQSWPFPHSFMLGYMADYAGGDITPDGVEILDADWFSVDDLPTLPPKFTIARRLIDRFLIETGAEVRDDSSPFFTAE